MKNEKILKGTAFVAIFCVILLASVNIQLFQTMLYLKGAGDLEIEVHVTMRHWRNGELIGQSHHPGTLTTAGKNWIEDQLGDSPSTDPAKWIGLSNSTDSPSAAWTVIPDEITTGGMGRAAGTYANVGDGSWNITKSFSPTESNSTRLTGLYYVASGAGLLAADTITVTNYQNGDTVEIEWSISVS